MNLENQVCSLDLAKRLKKLGVKQESLFYWIYSPYITEDFTWVLMYRNENQINKFVNNVEFISAFTVAELEELLPFYIQTQVTGSSSYDGKYYLKIEKGVEDWLIGYVMDHKLPPLIALMRKNLTTAFAEMLIWLIENGHVKV